MAGAFIHVPPLRVRPANALVRLRGSTGSFEPPLLACEYQKSHGRLERRFTSDIEGVERSCFRIQHGSCAVVSLGKILKKTPSR